MTRAGTRAIVQETLLTPLAWLAWALGLAVGCASGYGAHVQAPQTVVWLPVLCGAVVGSLVMALGVSTIEAGCKTLFVCYAEEPLALAARAPTLYSRFAETSPLNKDRHVTPQEPPALISP